MSEHFCTYFDHRYIVKGLTMWKSLKDRCDGATLHVLCLSEACQQLLEALSLPDVHLYSLTRLEEVDGELFAARLNRSLVEYYFTLTPCLPLHVFRAQPQVARLTYLDADLFFFADPTPIFEELGDAEIGLIEHRFPDDLAHLNRCGRFNVGWLTFRRSPSALACLERWRAQCLEWCYDRIESERFAEQKYLDEWPNRYPTHIIQHLGANVAPWNLNRHAISHDADGRRAGGQPLLFFHAHGFAAGGPGRPSELNLRDYGVEETPALRREIFGPYETALGETLAGIARPLALALLGDQSRNDGFLLEAVKAQLAASEADRMARVTAVEQLRRQLAASDSARVAQTEATEATRRALEAAQAQCADSHAAVRDLEARLEQTAYTLDGLRDQLAHARAVVERIERSRTWRWSRPMRTILSRWGRANGTP